jgi:aspartate/glutamate racemase
MLGRRPTLGLLMLQTRFPRPLGDIGNPATFPYRTITHVLPQIGPAEAVTAEALPPSIVDQVRELARSLEAEGADLIATSCGFLSPLQEVLAESVSVPVVSSALWVMPHLRAVHGRSAPIGILTFDSRRLSRRHVPDHGPYAVEGVEHGRELYRVIANDETELRLGLARDDAVAAARRLIERLPDCRAIVLECTNLPPYRDAIRQATGLPVYDIRQLIRWHLDALF